MKEALPSLAERFTPHFARVAVAICKSRIFQLDYEARVDDSDEECKGDDACSGEGRERSVMAAGGGGKSQSAAPGETGDDSDQGGCEYRVVSQRVLVPGIDLMNHAAVGTFGCNVETGWAIGDEDADVAKVGSH